MFKVSKVVAVCLLAMISSSVFSAQLININKADALTIAENLNGIGSAKAKAIVAYRALHGDFRDAGDLIKVKGVGSKLVERNRELISFTKGSALSGSVPKLTGDEATANAVVTPALKKDSGASAAGVSN